MGYMTTIAILNDAIDTIEANPKQFIKEIKAGMHGEANGYREGSKVTYHAVGNHANPLMVARSQHADIPQLHMTYGNSLVDFKDVEHYAKNEYAFDFMQNCIQRAEEIIEEAKITSQYIVAKEVLEKITAEGKTVERMHYSTIEGYVFENKKFQQLNCEANEIVSKVKKLALRA